MPFCLRSSPYPPRYSQAATTTLLASATCDTAAAPVAEAAKQGNPEPNPAAAAAVPPQLSRVKALATAGRGRDYLKRSRISYCFGLSFQMSSRLTASKNSF